MLRWLVIMKFCPVILLVANTAAPNEKITSIIKMITKKEIPR